MDFNYYLSENNGMRSINLIITDEAKSVFLKLKTQLRIEHADWDEETQRPKNIYTKRNKIINEKLNIIKIKIQEYFEEPRLNKRIAGRDLLKIINNVSLEKNMNAFLKDNSFLYYMEEYINIRKSFLKNSTLKRYYVFYNLIKLFEGKQNKRLLLENVNAEFISDFIIFCKSENYSDSTINRSVFFVKTILNYLENKGISTNVRELKIHKERKLQHDIITLTEKEILQIKKAIVPKELEASKDWLIISCYTGQRFSDFINFTKDQIIKINGKTCLYFIQQKTQKEITLPLHPEVNDIITKNNGKFPDIVKLHQYNKDIQQIAKIAKIENSVRYKKRVGFRSKNFTGEKWNALTSHIGRRSFATNFYGKIPTALLMIATGHSTEKMFQLYVNPYDRKNINELAEYFENLAQNSVV